MPSLSSAPRSSAQLSVRARSAGIACALTPHVVRNSSASAFRRSARRAVNTTSKPCDAKTRASAVPMPEDAPVISAVRPEPSPDSFIIAAILVIEIFGAHIVDQSSQARLQPAPIGNLEIQHGKGRGRKFLCELLQTPQLRGTLCL